MDLMALDLINDAFEFATMTRHVQAENLVKVEVDLMIQLAYSASYNDDNFQLKMII